MEAARLQMVSVLRRRFRTLFFQMSGRYRNLVISV